MSEWRLRQPVERKQDSLLAKIVLYICLILVPAGIGGCTAAYYYALGTRGRVRTEIAAHDTMPRLKQRFKIGALAGGLLGAVGCAYFTIQARRQRGDELTEPPESDSEEDDTRNVE
jgi:hypothetical protein